jgi:F0F1-type ATP synthase, epsilon subunit (mitochondrial delta subunit)
VQPQVITVLADTAARASDLDEASAQRAKKEAEDALANRTDAWTCRSPGQAGPGDDPVAGAGAHAQEPQALRFASREPARQSLRISFLRGTLRKENIEPGLVPAFLRGHDTDQPD